MPNTKPKFINKFLVREPLDCIGQIRIERSKPLSTLAAEHRFTAALLTSSREDVLAILEKAPRKGFADRFIACGANQLEALLYDRVIDLDVGQFVADFSLRNGKSLLEHLKTRAHDANTRFIAYDNLFIKLLDILSPLSSELVWLKGIVLARTLYASPYFRQSIDFDVLVKSDFEGVLNLLQSSGFAPIWKHPGECNQFGIGPTGSLPDLLIAPSKDFQPFFNLSVTMQDWPLVEIKSDPWDKGLKATSRQRFFDSCRTITWKGRSFQCPDTIDHLLLELAHFHKNSFRGWQSLYDIHLLATKLNETPDQWPDLLQVSRQEEELGLSAWAGLSITKDRLRSPVPAEIIDGLAPEHAGFLSRTFTFTTNTMFLWNSTSLKMLLFNALFLGDRGRKFTVLKQCLDPPPDFLSRYYFHGKPLNAFSQAFFLAVHWLVLLLPGGIIRRTFGRLFWT